MDIVKIDVSNDRFVLTGSIDKIKKNRRYNTYFRNLKPDYTVDGQMYINIKGMDMEELLSKIRKKLAKCNIREEYSDNIKKIHNIFFEEDQKFKKFSQKAYDIRNNNCNRDEFELFTKVVQSKMKTRTLYDIQLLSAYHLSFAQNACNFSVPGAGKTSIVYGAYAFLSSNVVEIDKYVDKILIIGPLSSFFAWETEYFECFGEEVNCKRLSGKITVDEKKRYLFSDYTNELTVISYQAVPSLIEELKFFLNNNNVMVVLDEAHKIKNVRGGIVANSVLELSRLCKSRVILTGTPAPNGYEDLYNLYKFIWPTKNIIEFHVNHLSDMSKNNNDSRVSKLINSIEPFFIRIKKSDLGLPEPIYNPPIFVEMDSQQRKIYDYIEGKYMEYLTKDNTDNYAKSVLSKARMIRLMQAATNPSLLIKPLDEYYIEHGFENDMYVDDAEIIRAIYDYSDFIPVKYKKTAELVNEIINRGEKVIVWVTFIKNICDLSEYLYSQGIKNKLLYGATPVDSNISNDENIDYDTRESIIKQFHKKDSEFKVIIANPFAVSESISLHKVCRNAIYVERSFNAAQFIQSKNRIHRYGLKANDRVNYYFIMSKNSIDTTINDRLNFKEDRMNEIIESMPIPLFDNLSQEICDEDIRMLMDDYAKRTK